MAGDLDTYLGKTAKGREKTLLKKPLDEQHKNLKNNITPVLDPARMYSEQADMCIRGLAKWMATKSYAPTIEYFAKNKRWDVRAVKSFFDDLAHLGLVEKKGTSTWIVTPLGFKRIGREPVEVSLPENHVARSAIIAKARRLKRELADPMIAEIMDIVPARGTVE